MRTNLATVLDPNRRSNDAGEFEAALRRKHRGPGPSRRKSGRDLPDVSSGVECAGASGGQSAFSGTDGFGKDARGGSHGRGPVRRFAGLHQDRLRRVPAFARDCKADRFASGILGTSGDASLLTQEALNQWFTEKLKLSILLFDEIEKASDSLWQLLLGILDKATLTLGDNRRVDLSQCIIIMTSNLGAQRDDEPGRRRLRVCARRRWRSTSRFDDKIQRTAVEAARRKFTPEFMNRIDKTVVFKTLRDEHLSQILDIELGMVQQRVLMAAGTNQFVFNCTAGVKEFLLKEGTDPRYGARHLKRAIERNLVFPLANLVATGQVKLGDFVRVDMAAEKQDDLREGSGEHDGAGAAGALRSRGR